MNKANSDIRTLAKNSGVKMWQIADKYGVHESTFCVMMRHTLSASDREKIIGIINQLAETEV